MFKMFKFYQNLTLGHYMSDSLHLEEKGVGFWSFAVAVKQPCMLYFKTDSRSETQAGIQGVEVMPRLNG